MDIPSLNMSAMSTPELREFYMDACKQHAGRWAEAKVDGGASDMMAIKGLDGHTPTERIAEMAAFNDHISAIKVELDIRDGDANAQAQLARATAMSNGGLLVPIGAAPQTLGQRFAASDEFKAFQGRTGGSSEALHLENIGPDALNGYDIRAALFQTGAGWAPPQIRSGRVELTPQQQPTLLDVIPQIQTALDTIRYMEETTFTNTAAFVAEQTATPTIAVPRGTDSGGGTATPTEPIPEAALQLTERAVPVEWLPISIPVTLQQLQDVAGIQGYIDSRLRFMLEDVLDRMVLAGNGNTPNIRGTLNVAGIQTKAKAGSDDIFDKIHEVMTDIMSDGQATPDTIILHPNNWHAIRTEKDANMNYKYGPPYLEGDLPVFGLRKIVTTHVPENTAVLGAYGAYSALHMRTGIAIDVTDSHGYDFRAGILRIRAMLRTAMVHYRPKAFGTVTGLNS